tara:strand:+ start:619 stop:2103 length:1485 start_codon:yes stop_codon:yes gene_type:complete
MNDLDYLRELQQTLLAYDKQKSMYGLPFMDFDRYVKQKNFRDVILNRVKTGVGAKIFVCFGGNRSGKTELGASIIAELMNSEKKLKLLCGTINYSMSVSVQQMKINNLINKKTLTKRSGVYDSIRGFPHETIENDIGNICYFRSYAQGRETFQGLDIDFAWLDEECSFTLFTEVLSRTADRNGVVLLTFTSLMGYTKLVNFLYDSDNPLIQTETLSILDNPFISQKAKEDIISTWDEDELTMRRDGKPHIKSGLVYKEFDNNIHLIEPFDYLKHVKGNPDRYQIHEGIDPHTRTPHHWLRFLYDRKNDILYVVDECKAPYESMLIEDYARLIKAKRNGTYPIYCQIDTSSQTPDVIHKVHSETGEYQEDLHTIRREFDKCGISTILCSKDNNLGINAVKNRLKVVKTKDGVIKRNPKLYVFNNLSGIRYEFKRYSWQAYASDVIAEKKETLNTVNKKDDHFLDCLKYECIKILNDYQTNDSVIPELPMVIDGMY